MKRYTVTSHMGLFPGGVRLPCSAPGLLLLILSLLVTVAALAPSNTVARPTRPYETSFGSFAGADGSYTHGPGMLAVDQANGDIYVQDIEHSESSVISRFTSTGEPDNFTAGPYAETNSLTGFFGSGTTVAIDRAGGPTDGYIFVSSPTRSSGTVGTVKIFANDGTPVGTLDGSGAAESFTNAIFAVAVDQSSGDIYVGDYNASKIWRYAPKSPAIPIDDSDFTVTGVKVGRVGNIVADSGNVYVATAATSGEGGRLLRYPATAFTTNPKVVANGSLIDGNSVNAVAVDPKNGDVYADEGDRVAVYDSAGARLYDFGHAADFGTASAGVAVRSAASGAASKVYVSDPQPGGKEIDVFGPVANVPVLSHPLVASFGNDGSADTAFSSSLDQLAFNQSTRRLFALDRGLPGLYGFDASSPPAYSALSGLAPLSTAPMGARAGLAVDNTALDSAGNLYLVSTQSGLIYGFDSTGAPLGGAFPVDTTVTPGGPDGSPAALCGAAVDSTGNVWIANRSTSRILKFSSAGASLPGSIDTSAQSTQGLGLCGLAFDSSDNLYVDMDGVVWRYSAASSYSAATLIDGSAGRFQESIPQIGGIAVDRSNDHLYVSHWNSENGQGGKTIYSNWVDEFDAAGNFVDEFAAGAADSQATGIAVDETNHYLYLSDASSKRILVLAPGAILPEVEIGPVSVTANTTATLSGKVGTQQIALSDCHFEYVSEVAFGLGGFSDLSSGGSAPCSPAFGSIPLDFTTHSVTGSAIGMTANTDYRVRLVAANANGVSASADAEFTTPSRPIVETTGAPIRTATSAQLGGRVDPRNATTTYFFEYGNQGPCDANPCTQTEAMPAGSGHLSELVSEEIGELQPNTTYHYRLAADNGNSDGVAVGADMTVTTRVGEAPLSHGHFPGPAGSDRAWELVSAPESGGNPVEGADVISDDGSRAVWGLGGGSPLTDIGGFSYLYSERTASGWQASRAYPSRAQLVGPNWHPPTGSHDLSSFTALNYTISGAYALFRITPGSPAVMLHSVPTEQQFTGLDLTSDNGSRSLMATSGDDADPAHPVSPGTNNIFDVTTPGSPHLASLLPGNVVPVCGTTQTLSSQSSPYNVNGGATSSSHFLTPDGERFFFMSEGNDCTSQPQLYMRDFGAAETKLLSGSPVSGPQCGAGFIKSVPGAAFFWSKSRLVAEDTAPQNCSDETADGDIYRYDLRDGSRRCVTCVVAGADADVLVPGFQTWRFLLADDGSRAYFTSARRLLPGASTPGAYRVDIESGELAYVGSPGPQAIGIQDALTPDGSVLFFSSSDPSLNPLGGGAGNAGTAQLYRYDDNDRSLVCVSCPRDGSAPRGDASEPGGLVADDGTFAFSTPTPLLAADQNTAGPGQGISRGTDAYEWRDGRLLLVSDGLTDWPGPDAAPRVKGITPSGKDILFIAATQYTSDALDDFLRLYDARIGGGIEFPPPRPPCPLEVCQGTPRGAPEEQAPGTGTFAGPGGATKPSSASCRKGKVRRKGRCVAKKPSRKHRSRANHNRRNAR